MRTALLIAALSALAQSSATATASVEIVQDLGGFEVDGGALGYVHTSDTATTCEGGQCWTTAVYE